MTKSDEYGHVTFAIFSYRIERFPEMLELIDKNPYIESGRFKRQLCDGSTQR
jgi:hypothetical protein